MVLRCVVTIHSLFNKLGYDIIIFEKSALIVSKLEILINFMERVQGLSLEGCHKIYVNFLRS
ncbi:MAG: hypothetical protein IKM97_02355, partial [Clostridia bacterium]|nr:hypothetical protein [Clostridia bacterium]